MRTHPHDRSAAQAYIQPLLPDGAVATSSRTIARDLDAGRLADLDAIIDAAGFAVGDHQRIKIETRTRAIAHSVDALVLARPIGEVADDAPKTLDQLMGLVGAGSAKLILGASLTDLFLGLYAAHRGRLPSAVEPMTHEGISGALADLDRLCAASAPQPADQAAQAFAAAPDAYALMAFGTAMSATDQIATAPLRLTPDGAPVAVLDWSGWGLTPDASAGALSQTVEATQFDQLDDAAQTAAIWLLDGFSPDARHAGLLETIAAGAALAPADLWFSTLRADVQTVLEAQDMSDRTAALLAL